MGKPDDSGAGAGSESFLKLRKFLDSTDQLPSHGGRVDKKAVAAAAGISRSSLYQNQSCADLIEQHVQKKGLVAPPEDEIRAKLERRITQLERTNSDLVAQVYELRRKLARLSHIEAIVEKGRI